MQYYEILFGMENTKIIRPANIFEYNWAKLGEYFFVFFMTTDKELYVVDWKGFLEWWYSRPNKEVAIPSIIVKQYPFSQEIKDDFTNKHVWRRLWGVSDESPWTFVKFVDFVDAASLLTHDCEI